MDPFQTVLHSLIPLGPIGGVLGAMLWIIKSQHDELRAERESRLKDAERVREIVLELQERLLSACTHLGAVANTVVDITRQKR